jgi:hypothetical protein
MSHALVALALAAGAEAGSPERSRVPVLVELFTSEGCSSCPSADALLMRLVRDQPVPGVQVVALAEHVDYWDHLGWRDPFSSSSFTERQSAYARRLGASLYTPQLVASGASHVVGSDERAVRAAIAAAAARVRGEVSARVVAGAQGVLAVTARWPDGVEADIVVALVADHATSAVSRGENAGRTLEHVAIARRIAIGGSGTGSFSGQVALPAGATADRAVVFVQERSGGRVHAVATVDLRGR